MSLWKDGRKRQNCRRSSLPCASKTGGVAAIIYTDISRDGMLAGLNLEATAELARSVSIPVIASGGLSGIEDIERLASPAYGMIAGAIAGRALYDGRLDAGKALGMLQALGR